METVKINVNVDKQTKINAEKLFEELGLNMTTAINIFLKKALQYKGIPFDVCAEIPNEVTLAAFAEYEEMKKHPEKYPRYNSASEVFASILGDAQ